MDGNNKDLTNIRTKQKKNLSLYRLKEKPRNTNKNRNNQLQINPLTERIR